MAANQMLRRLNRSPGDSYLQAQLRTEEGVKKPLKWDDPEGSEIKKPCRSRASFLFVGVARFELATSWSQTRRDDRATLHPELLG